MALNFLEVIKMDELVLASDGKEARVIEGRLSYYKPGEPKNVDYFVLGEMSPLAYFLFRYPDENESFRSSANIFCACLTKNGGEYTYVQVPFSITKRYERICEVGEINEENVRSLKGVIIGLLLGRDVAISKRYLPENRENLNQVISNYLRNCLLASDSDMHLEEFSSTDLPFGDLLDIGMGKPYIPMRDRAFYAFFYNCTMKESIDPCLVVKQVKESEGSPEDREKLEEEVIAHYADRYFQSDRIQEKLPDLIKKCLRAMRKRRLFFFMPKTRTVTGVLY